MKIKITFNTNWFVNGDLIKPQFTEQRVYRVIFTHNNDVVVEPVYEYVTHDIRINSLWEKVAHEIVSGDALWDDLGRTESRKIKLLKAEVIN